MQETRRYILDVLREQTKATVDSIVDSLCSKRGKNITAVTVRHHLNILQQEGLVTEPELRHRNTPGRPQHVYTLTPQALQTFPNNYQQLIKSLIGQLEDQLSPENINVIFHGVADNMAATIPIPNDLSVEQRLNIVVEYLNDHGYDATWEESPEGYVLHTHNCPYHHISHKTNALCSMDLRLMTLLMGVAPRRIKLVSEGASSCAYLFPETEMA